MLKAVGKGNFAGFCQEMGRGRGTEPELGQVKLFEYIEHLDDVYTAGTRRAKRHDFMPAIVSPNGFAA